MKPTSRLRRLETANRKLTGEINNLKTERSLTLENTLSTMLSGAQAYSQSNLTSFNPILRNNIYAPLTINWTLLTYMYKTHGVIQTAIDMPVMDALRGGIEIQSDELDADDTTDILDDLEEDGTIESIIEGMTWTRLYGGGALIINTDQDPSKPLNEKKVGRVELYPANRWELFSAWKPNDAMTELTPWAWAAAKNTDEVYFYGERIHKSRILTMSGKPAPYIIRWQLQGWGMSEVERMVEDFNAYIETKNVLYDLLHEAKMDVYRFEGFNNQLATAGGTQKTLQRLQTMNQAKNFNNAIMMDMKDEYEQKQLTFSGLAEVMKENRIGIASALRMPMTKLFGLSASGFNSGEDDIENYNAMVESEVRQPLRRVIRKVLALKFQAKFGYVPTFKFNFKPLRVLGEVEEETVKTSKQNRYLADYDRGLIDSKEYGQLMQKENLMPIKTKAADGLLDDHPAPAAHGFSGDGNEGEDGDESGYSDKDSKNKKKPEETDNE